MERPILFSVPMVRAILAGTKTQTRRPVQMPRRGAFVVLDLSGRGWWPYESDDGESALCNDGNEYPMRCPCGSIGDRLWVRETFALIWPGESEPDDVRSNHVEYRADKPGARYPGDWPDEPASRDDAPGWRPSIHMPRWVSRITLEITDVRVERLQDISESDAAAEGLQRCRWAIPEEPGDCFLGVKRVSRRVLPYSYVSAAMAFESIWDQLYARTYPWSDNPWTWVVDFELIANEKQKAVAHG